MVRGPIRAWRVVVSALQHDCGALKAESPAVEQIHRGVCSTATHELHGVPLAIVWQSEQTVVDVNGPLKMVVSECAVIVRTACHAARRVCDDAWRPSFAGRVDAAARNRAWTRAVRSTRERPTGFHADCRRDALLQAAGRVVG